MSLQPHSNRRKEANDRERRRMKHLNDCFDILRQQFHWFVGARDRVWSKVQVLKYTKVYVQELEKRVDPQALGELQENFHVYAEREDALTLEKETNDCKRKHDSTPPPGHEYYSRRIKRTTCEYEVEYHMYPPYEQTCGYGYIPPPPPQPHKPYLLPPPPPAQLPPKSYHGLQQPNLIKPYHPDSTS